MVNAGSHGGIHKRKKHAAGKVFSIVLMNFDVILKEYKSESAAKTLRNVFSEVSKIACRRREDAVFSALSSCAGQTKNKIPFMSQTVQKGRFVTAP